MIGVVLEAALAASAVGLAVGGVLAVVDALRVVRHRTTMGDRQERGGR